MRLKRIFFLLMMLASFTLIACAQGPYGSQMGNWGHMMGYGYGGGFMWIIVLALVGVIIYFLLQASKSKSPDGSVMETPLEILKKRYAKGEIDKEEFDRKKEDLKS
ncbi:MAG: SHOCT domain-containing protein [Deltaproteobacteria bacterium]|nr:SHOCT domain-containing protein [Deltaproteobacteria bacterium]